MHAAIAAPSAATDSWHSVQFYEEEEQLTDVVATFLADGLSRDGSAIMIATEAHRGRFLAGIAARGVDVDAARATGRLIVLDAEETLARFLVDGFPDRKRFHDMVDAAIAMATRGDASTPVRAFGEMVDVLWRAGNSNAAIELEELWNDAQRDRSFQLLCAYVMASFYKQASGIERVCATHSQVHAPPLGDSPNPHAVALAAEIAQRVEVERALRDTVRDLRHSRERAEVLYGLAREVIVADSVEEVFRAALDAIEHGLGATRASILTFGADPVMRFRAWRGLSDDYRAAVDGHSPWTRDVKDPQPIVVADVTADPALAGYRPVFDAERIGALAFFPLVSGRKLLGKFTVCYEAPRPLQPSELDLARAIADHVAAAVARFAAVDELRETVRFNEMFTGILGHDLRNPLGAIVTAAQLAIARGPGERITKPLARILTSSARMTRMIEQLLDFTRVRVGGGIPLAAQPIDLAQVVRQVMEELEDANPEWSLRLEHVGNTVGAWDGDRLGQVFSNLVANAVQHGEVAGGVRVRVDGTQRDRIRIEIHNAGTIPADVIPTIFDPMAGSLRRRNGSRGLGLGLYISREIVRTHRGTIAVESGPTTGTTFAIELPR